MQDKTTGDPASAQQPNEPEQLAASSASHDDSPSERNSDGKTKAKRNRRKSGFARLHRSTKWFSLLMLLLSILVMVPSEVFPLPNSTVMNDEQDGMGKVVLARHGWPYVYMDSIHVLDVPADDPRGISWSLEQMDEKSRYDVGKRSLYRLRYDSYLVSAPFSGLVNLPNPKFPVAPWMTSNGWNFRGHARVFRRQGLAVNLIIMMGFVLIMTLLFEFWRRLRPSLLTFQKLDAALLLVGCLAIGGWWYSETRSGPTDEQWQAAGTARCEAPEFLQRLTGSAPYKAFYNYQEPVVVRSGGRIGLE